LFKNIHSKSHYAHVANDTYVKTRKIISPMCYVRGEEGAEWEKLIFIMLLWQWQFAWDHLLILNSVN